MEHRCEWPAARCVSTDTKLVEFNNYWGRTVRHWFCDVHIAAARDTAGARKRIDNLMQAWNATPTVLTPEELETHPAQVALRTHQEACEQCAAVRDWTTQELSEGRVKDMQDVNRIGQYTLDNCCPEGAELNAAVGRARLGQ